MLEPAQVYARLETLMGADLSNRVLGSAQHRYLLTPPWPEDRVRAFETRHRVELPPDYRHFLRKIGSAGAGPGYGLFEPGTWDGEPTRWDGTRAVAPLVRAFRHQRAWNLPQHQLAAHLAEHDDDGLGEQYLSPEIAAGAMPIAGLGRGTHLLLVISGGERGKIWIDDRAHENGLSPEAGLDFEAWYRTWLDGAEQMLVKPMRRRTTGRRGDRPSQTVQLVGAAADAAERLRGKVHAALAAGQPYEIGGLGKFSAGPHPHFEQGVELRDAVAIRTPPPGTGDAHVLFVALFERVATGAAVEVPGLFTVWRAAAATWDSFDYLARRQVAEEPPMLIIADDPTLPKT
jgi:hypothetical protein